MPFAVTEGLLGKIAEKLGIKVARVKKINNHFQKTFLRDDEHGLENQYLAHLIRSMESVLRKKTNNWLFQILVQKLPEDDPKLAVGTGQYQKNRFFVVYYHPRIDPKQLRVGLAHELGHLYLTALMDQEQPKEATEGLASTFGCLAIIDKNWFYQDKCKDFLHSDALSIVDDFAQLNNRKKGKFNIS